MNSTKEMRDFLVEQMKKVASGDLDMARGKAVANLAQQVYNTMAIELKVAKWKQESGNAPVEPVEFSAQV